MTRIMGVVNVTPDSFSDGGRWLRADAAVGQALRLCAEGAQLIDVGGESTRPGAVRISPLEEQRRVLPVVAELAAQGVVVSIDTMNAETAAKAIAAGAQVVNDVTGAAADPGMLHVLADADATLVLGHWHEPQLAGHRAVVYRDVCGTVRDELAARVDAALAAGVRPERLVLDPGLGFSKRAEDNWQLLAGLPRLLSLGFPLMLGASRKRFLGELLAAEATVEDRDVPTAVCSVLAAQAGVWAVRVHNVAVTAAALATLRAVTAAGDRVAARGEDVR